jgi:hypothetical protein
MRENRNLREKKNQRIAVIEVCLVAVIQYFKG